MNLARYLTCCLVLAAIVFATAPPAFATWSTNPAVNTPVCLAAEDQSNAVAIPDGAGGAIISWQDTRLGFSNINIYAQRVDATGTPLWASDGIVVCDAANNQSNPIAAGDGAGGVFILWRDLRAGPAHYAQHIDGNGNPLWPANGIAFVTGAGGNESVTPDGFGGFICAWEDPRYDPQGNIWAQRMSGGGTAYWLANGVAVCTAANYQTYMDITSDGAGGAIITWQDSRTSISEYGVYAQRMNAAGNAVWTANGIVVCNLNLRQRVPKIVPDGAGGAIIAWQDQRMGGDDINVYAQRVNSTGSLLWPTDGADVCTFAGNQSVPLCASDGTGGAIVCWLDTRTNPNMYAQRLSGAGAQLWNPDGVPMASTTSNKLNHAIVSDGSGGALLAWQDLRGTNSYDIYIQRISSLGMPAWATNGAAMGTAALAQQFPAVVSDGAGGAIVAFQDPRNGTDNNIYAQEINGNGVVGGGLLPTGVNDGGTPATASLHQNYPNPFNPATTISFDLGARSFVSLRVFDVRGREVATLIQGELPAGTHTQPWHALDLASGVYLYRLSVVPSAMAHGIRAGDGDAFVETRKLVLLK
ncbi:MAG: T9SS type A sorting domain-containing protein [Candidatus Krumholzibacteria bacterium]|nr:T9SS type A sorting domain-containing protein [Candidatus Krumholzibacteria bacterium]MDH5269794.1 T9SS type A sorting domain-containing protein [Candidatus Krumholzibacteria bacterium]